jgi:hypothetical protein
MGRQQSQHIGDGPVANLGFALRDLQRKASLSYRDMSDLTNYSRAALNNAVIGKRCPSWEVLCAFVKCCGGEVDDRWRALWEAAHAPGPRRALARQCTQVEEPKTTNGPGRAATPEEFVRELRLLHMRADSPNALMISQAWREMPATDSPLKRRQHLPKSTLYEAIKDGRTTLPRLEIVRMIVYACGADVEEWTQAWQRIKTSPFY